MLPNRLRTAPISECNAHERIFMLRSWNNHVHQLESHQRMNLVSDKVNYGLRQRGANRVGLGKTVHGQLAQNPLPFVYVG